jgi:acetate kinase
LSGLAPCGFGHRIVHGGEVFTHSLQINDAVVAAICQTLPPKAFLHFIP